MRMPNAYVNNFPNCPISEIAMERRPVALVTAHTEESGDE